MTWADQAACRGTPEELWFPRTGNRAAYTAARWYCDRCPVRTECLEDALRTDIPCSAHGMRAGLTPGEREDILAGRAPVPHFPPPITIHKGAPVMSVTDITPAAPREPTNLVEASAPHESTNPVPTTSDELIAWGAGHQSSRLQALAGRACGALAGLRQAAERETKVASAEAKIERLRAQLANAEQDLRAAKGAGKAKAAGAGGGEDYAAIRAWARSQGIEVSPVGVPKRSVRDAFYAAQAA